VVGVAAVVVAVGLMLSGCSFAEQYQQVVDDLAHTQELQADLDALLDDIRELDGVESASADSALAFAPSTAALDVRMLSAAAPAQWTAVADSVMAAAEGGLVEVEVAVVQQSDALHVDYPADAAADPIGDIEFAARLGELIGPGVQVSLIRAAPSWSRVIGSIDRADASPTRALAAHAAEVREIAAAAPERFTQWLLPGISFMGGLPSDDVLALVAQTTLALPPNSLPGDEVTVELPDEAIWFGYTSVGAGDSVVIGALVPATTDPASAELWPEYLALVTSALDRVDGTVIVNVQWRDGGGILTRAACADGASTSTPDDEALGAALRSGGVDLTGVVAGYCGT
jgi:outer membrane murein-binding lipoprotein Lpp